MNKIIRLALLVVILTGIACSKSGSPEAVVSEFFELSKEPENLDEVKALLAGEALEEHDRSFFDTYDVTYSILDKAVQENGTVRLKIQISTTDKKRESRGKGTDVLTLSVVDGGWKIIKRGGPFKDFDLDNLRDTEGKTPFDYADEYFEAMNQSDLAKLQSLYGQRYYDYIIRDGTFVKEPDPDRLEEEIKKTESYELDDKRTELLGSKADGLFRAAFTIMLTDEFAKEFGDKYLGGKVFKGPGGYEIYFKLVDGVWRITNRRGI